MTKTKTPLSLESAQDLESGDRERVLGIIDQFRALGVNEDVSLPQLVVVGDQSSGKSSLLEGLTGLNFPIASQLCTRFATQIILRRDVKSAIRVSILPGPAANENADMKSRLEGFAHDIDNADLTASAFAEILDQASICMGLPGSVVTNFDDLPKRFSSDVLRIELSGPKHPHLSVVDVPGLFHNPTKFQTLEDLAIIRSLLQTYIVDRRTIILAVMDAYNNLANQEVFCMARAADPEGKRTVGIITKCDAVPPGDEDSVLDIASNKVERLTHGWFAVRNRSTKEISEGVDLNQRHINEKRFFSTAPWNSLPKSRTGITSLKSFLATLLYNHIREEFPALVQDLRRLIVDSRQILEQLGAPRQTSIQQRQFLSRIAEKYQTFVQDSLYGGYPLSWESHDVRKLRMHLHRHNEAFAADMHARGHMHSFRAVGGDDALSADSTAIYDWIRTSYRQSRGAELHGTINPILMQILFRQQASPWTEIARKHLEIIDTTALEFNKAVWPELVAEASVRDRLQALNYDAAKQAKLEASRLLNDLIDDEFSGILQTVNHYYADNVNAARMDRLKERFKEHGYKEGQSYDFELATILSTAQLSNEDQAVFDIHDTLKAFYKVAIKRFTDSVVLQCVERCYVGKNGPLKTTSPARIGELTDAELDHIASESYDSSSRRQETMQRLQRLEKALAMAEKESM